jgi:4-amino-4-deoxy-L-arabinose transferase-like glycosyltransferase
MLRTFSRLSASTLLLCILILAAVLRLYNLSDLPSGFHGDEASFLYNAVAIKESGRDEDNQYLPLMLRSFVDPKPALFSYIQIPFITIFGPTPFAARLPSVILGLLSIIGVYYLVKRLTNSQAALLVTLLLSLSPWHILLSRASQEVIMSFSFTIFAILAMERFLSEKKKPIIWFTATLVLGMFAMYSYHSNKVFLPAFAVALVIIFVIRDRSSWKKGLLLLGSLAVILGGIIQATGITRFSAVSVFTDPNISLLLTEKIGTATGFLPDPLIRVFNNKVIDYLYTIGNNYGQYFTSFLFFSGGQPDRYRIPFHGLMYAGEAVLLLFGLFYGFTEKSVRQATRFFFIWLLLAPLPAAFTMQEIPSIIRSFAMLLPLLYFVALGIIFSVRMGKHILTRRLITGGILAFYLFSTSYFLYIFSVLQPNYHPWHRNYGSGMLANYVKANFAKYDQIVISTNDYVYFALADVIPLADLQSSYPKRLQEFSQYGKLEFYRNECAFYPKKQRTLLAVRGHCNLEEGNAIHDYMRQIGSIPFKDGSAHYKLYEYYNPSLPK